MAALSEIQKLEARYAENPDGRFFAPLADAYRKAGDLDRALELVSANIPKHPDYLSAHIVLGRCFLDKKDDPGAATAFQRVLELDGENIIALKSLSEIAERTGDGDAARRWLQRLLAIDAMNTEAADDLARLGGPLPEEGAEAVVEAAAEPDARVSFADLIEPEPVPEPASAPTLAAPAMDVPEVPRTIERLAVKWPPPAPPPEPAREPEPVSEPVPMLDLEPVAFEPPPPDAVPTAPTDADLVPFDDQLAWGAGERRSLAISAADVAEAEAHHEATAGAIDFLGGAPAGAGAAADEPPAAPAAAAYVDPNMSTLPMDGIPPPPAWASPPAPASQTPTLEIEPVRVPSAGAEGPEPAPVEDEAPRTSGDLQLIMPEDVTPAEEMRRPSSKQIHMVSPEVEPVARATPPEPLATETMGDLYLRQGLKDQAADVYRRLLAQRPDDAAIKAKLAAIESPPAMSASALGSEAVGSWLRRIAKAQLPTGAPTPAPAPEAGPTPMEQAFAPESAAQPPVPTPAASAVETPALGNPAHQATDQFSLDQLFGAGPQAAGAAPTAAPAPHTLGSSFDEFFGSAPKPETVRPKEGSAGARQSEDDLSAFNAWLHGLKR